MRLAAFTKSSLRKAFSLSFPQLLAQTIAIKASIPKGGLLALFLLLLALGESPRTRHGFTHGMRKRAAIDASTPAAYFACPFLFAPWRWFLLPSALRSCAVGLVACLLLGRLACKGDEDMSPWPGIGAGLRAFWRCEEEATGSSW